MLKSTKTRSILANNVDVMLENVSAIRQRNKIDSDDLFGGGDQTDNVINWKTDGPVYTDFQVLLLEKESLGIYVSGNPLREYEGMQRWVREMTFADDIHLVIINKARKIFTKSNHMMFALDLTTTGEPVEGIIFPKLAPTYSNILEEKDLYWVRGRISQKKKKKPEEEIAAVAPGEGGEEGGREIKEYDELPKLIVDAICKFENGPVGLFEDSTSLSSTRIEIINSINWPKVKINPAAFGDDDQSNSQTQNTSAQTAQNPEPKPQKVVLKKHLGAAKLKQIHQSISRENKPGSQEIELWVESGGELKKVKGPLWIDHRLLSDIS